MMREPPAALLGAGRLPALPGHRPFQRDVTSRDEARLAVLRMDLAADDLEVCIRNEGRTAPGGHGAALGALALRFGAQSMLITDGLHIQPQFGGAASMAMFRPRRWRFSWLTARLPIRARLPPAVIATWPAWSRLP